METIYNLIITGNIGAGKTTVIDYILERYNSYNICHYKEYLDNSILASSMLKAKLNGELSNYIFQRYVIDSWKSRLEINEKLLLKNNNKNTIKIWERLPDDALICFSYLDFINNLISEDEFYDLYKYTKTINKQYNVNSYFDNINSENISIINANNKLDTVINDVEKIINEDISKNQSFRIIYLKTTPSISLSRIKHRGRAGENNYTLEQIIKYDTIYNNLINTILKGKLRSICDLGAIF